MGDYSCIYKGSGTNCRCLKIIERENYPTLSYYIPMVIALMNILSDTEDMNNDEKQLAEMHENLIDTRLVLIFLIITIMITMSFGIAY